MNTFLKNGIEVDISDHGMQRMEERTGLNTSAERENVAWYALCYGLRTEECEGYLYDCMKHYERPHHKEKGRELRYYKGMIYVFEGNCLVTTFAPREAVRQATMKKHERQKIAKYAKRMRNECDGVA